MMSLVYFRFEIILKSLIFSIKLKEIFKFH